jgi:hypothetical protein
VVLLLVVQQGRHQGEGLAAVAALVALNRNTGSFEHEYGNQFTLKVKVSRDFLSLVVVISSSGN